MLSSTLPYNSRTPPVETDYVLTVHLQNLPFFMYFCLLIICHLFNILFTCFSVWDFFSQVKLESLVDPLSIRAPHMQRSCV